MKKITWLVALLVTLTAARARAAGKQGATDGMECPPGSHLSGDKKTCLVDPIVCPAGTHHATSDPRSSCVPDTKVCVPPVPAWLQCPANQHNVVIDCKRVCVSDDCKTKDILCGVGYHAEKTNACGWDCIKDIQPNKCPPPTIVCPDGTHAVQNSDCSAICLDASGQAHAALSEGGSAAPGTIPPADDVVSPPDAVGRPVGN